MSYKCAVEENKQDGTSSEGRIEFKKGWVYLYKNTSFFDNEEGSFSEQVEIAIHSMEKNWERNKDYDYEMLPYEQYSSIYDNSEEVFYDTDTEDCDESD
jgi:hypothetical protein